MNMNTAKTQEAALPSFESASAAHLSSSPPPPPFPNQQVVIDCSKFPPSMDAKVVVSPGRPRHRWSLLGIAVQALLILISSLCLLVAFRVSLRTPLSTIMCIEAYLCIFGCGLQMFLSGLSFSESFFSHKAFPYVSHLSTLVSLSFVGVICIELGRHQRLSYQSCVRLGFSLFLLLEFAQYQLFVKKKAILRPVREF